MGETGKKKKKKKKRDFYADLALLIICGPVAVMQQLEMYVGCVPNPLFYGGYFSLSLKFKHNQKRNWVEEVNQESD